MKGQVASYANENPGGVETTGADSSAVTRARGTQLVRRTLLSSGGRQWGLGHAATGLEEVGEGNNNRS